MRLHLDTDFAGDADDAAALAMLLGWPRAGVVGATTTADPGGDDAIDAIAEPDREVVVVTADRELAQRVRAANAEVVGPSWLLDQLVD